MITHKYRTIDVSTSGGALRVGVWDPIEVHEGAAVPSVLAIHGVTASHLAWQRIVPELHGTRVIAPDLRGRGASNQLQGATGLCAHVSDLIAVLDALSLDSVPVIGHSMGGFVAVVLAHLAPERVSSLMLVDGGLTLDTPPGLTPEQLVPAILGSTAKRLSMRFASVDAYFDFWRAHPAFADDWSPEIEVYFAYDLVPAGDALRPATSLETTTEDTVDMNVGTVLPEALAALGEFAASGRQVLFVSVPRGLRNETPGLYSQAHLERVLQQLPFIEHVHLDDLNHYTVVMGETGALRLGEVLRAALG